MPNLDPRKLILDSFISALNSLDPATVMEKHSRRLSPLNDEEKVAVIGFGKASYRMFEGFKKGYSGTVEQAAIIIPDDQKVRDPPDGLEILRGSHPYPTQISLNSSRRILDIINNTKDIPVIFLISGGASSLFEIPVDGISIEDLESITKQIMNNGANIYQLNSVRQALSLVKGGKLVRFLRGRRIYSFMISDVPEDRQDIIASGPLSPSNTTRNEVWHILRKFLKESDLTAENLMKLANFDFPQRNEFSMVTSRIVLKNDHFVRHISSMIRNMGYRVISIGSGIAGDVSEVAKSLNSLALSISKMYNNDFFIVGGGETTSTVQGNGKGGRNQELVIRVFRMGKCHIDTFMSAGTDGIDGNSSYAGGIATAAEFKKIDPDDVEKALKNSDSSSFLERHGMVIDTGPTGNNVSDVFTAFVRGGKKREA